MESSLSTTPLVVTEDEFKSFHTIDRTLFHRLIFVLGRDPYESVQVMGFWLWLEQDHMKDLNIINRILKNVDLQSLDQMADETVFCIALMQTDAVHPELVACELRSLQQVLTKPLSLPLLHENRLAVLRNVSRVVGDVCVRAFRDMLRYAVENPIRGGFPKNYQDEQQVGQDHVVEPMRPMGPMGMQIGYEPFDPMMGPAGATVVAPAAQMSTIETEDTLRTRPIMVGTQELWPQYYAQTGLYPTRAFEGQGLMEGGQNGGHGYMPQGFPNLDEQTRYVGPNQLAEMFTHNLRFGNISEHVEDDVPADKRTIFLTFSKGYPISENEVREFITRKFGDIIDAIYMQEVQGDEQALYARVVAKTRAMVDMVVDGGRAKYYINGKHVCARKYVRNGPRSPPRARGQSEPF